MSGPSRIRWRDPLVWGVLALVVAACAPSDPEFLADRGPVLDWVGEADDPPPPEVTTTTLPTFVGASVLDWVNDDLALGDADATPTEITSRIYAQSSGTDRFVQAAASDIAAVLPGVDVPGKLPADVTHVSSQLVFDTASRRLSNDPAAAFGFWTAEPYSQSRSVAQRAVLMVSLDAASADQLPDPALVCQRFEERGPCEPTIFDGTPGWWIVEDGGETLVWYAAPHRYELRVRRAGGREVVEEMASSSVALVGVVIAPEVGSAGQ